MNILNGTVADNPLAHVYELSNYLVISGSIYNKNPMYPLPLKFGLLDDPNSSIYFKETYDVTDATPIRYRNNKNTYIADKSDHKVHYGFYENLGMFKMTECDEGLDIVPYEFTKTTDVFSVEYSMQTDKCVVFIVRYESTADIHVVDKTTLASVNIFNYTGYCTTLGTFYDKYTDEHYLHFYNFNYGSTYYAYFYSICLSSGEQATVGSYYGYSNNSTTYRFVVDVIRQSDTQAYFHGCYRQKASMCNYKITGNTAATIRWNDLISSVNNSSRTDIKAYLFHPEVGYFAHVKIPCSSDAPATIPTLEVSYFDEGLSFSEGWDNTASYASYKMITLDKEHQTYGYTVCGKIKDDKTLFFANNEKLVVYKWDVEEKTYTLYYEHYEGIEKIGIDANGNLWIRNTDKDLHTVDIEHSEYYITLSADETDFDYNNTDINTTIKVKALDKKGNHVACHVILKIEGVAKFTETGEQIIEVDLIGEEMEIPITIFDQGIINIVYLN